MTRFLAACRLLLVVPVLGCVLLTAASVLMGFGRIFAAGAQLLSNPEITAKSSKIIALVVIEIIDLFLVGTVAYITAVGLYKLFIATKEVDLPFRLKIRSLKELEDKIIGVIVAALAVAFLGQAAAPTKPETLLNYGGAIALVIAALGFFVSKAPKSTEDD